MMAAGHMRPLILGNIREYRNKYAAAESVGDSVYLQPLLHAPVKLPNSMKLRMATAITPSKVIQGHLFWYQSKAHMRLPVSH